MIVSGKWRCLVVDYWVVASLALDSKQKPYYGIILMVVGFFF